MKKKLFLKACILTGFMLIASIINAQNFKTVWENSQGGAFTVVIPINLDKNLTYNYDVDWDNDGVFDLLNQTTSVSHNYTTSGPHTVTIKGDFPAIFMKESSTQEYLIDIEEWGSSITWETMAFAFAGCENIGAISATDNPVLTSVTDMSYMFHNCENMNGTFNAWNVSDVELMRGTFSKAETFNNSISSWDVSNVTDMTSMFDGAISFDQELPWTTTSLSEMSYMFANAKSFNKSVNSFTVSGVTVFDGIFSGAESFKNGGIALGMGHSTVTSMRHMFEGASSFDQDLGSWNIAGIEDMSYMLSASGLSDCNYENTLSGWSSSAPTSNVTLGADGLIYYNTTGRNSLTTKTWTIKGDIENSVDDCQLSSNICNVGLSTFFITSWEVPSNGTITIPTNSSYSYDYEVEWNKSNVWKSYTGDAMESGLPANTTIEVRIREKTSGGFPTIFFNNSATNKDNIISIDQWGCIEWESFESAFAGCSNLEFYNATDAPNLLVTTTPSFKMNDMFKDAVKFDGDLSSWDVSEVKNMSGMFEGAALFDNGGQAFNWGTNTENVTNMSNMFKDAVIFNRDISGWDVSEVKYMTDLFNNAVLFNRDLSSWDVSKVTTMQGMFQGATLFNNGGQALNWGTKTNNVTNMIDMFNSYLDLQTDNGSAFNADISNWDVSNVTNMSYMFKGTPFDQNITGWKTGKVTQMPGMFEESSFNRDISPGLNGEWDVSDVTNMDFMFRNATLFDGEIGDWQLDKITSIRYMFKNAQAFNQDLDDWDISRITNFVELFDGATAFNNGDSGNNGSNPLTSWASRIASGTGNIIFTRMFKNSAFNQDITNWPTNKVTFMTEMFSGASDFNQNITGTGNVWDVSNVTNFYAMFANASDFNQDLGSWDISSVGAYVSGPFDFNSMHDMLDNCGMSCSNYSSTLIQWSLGTINTGVRLGAFGLTYSTSTATANARTTLTNSPNNWIITDNGTGSCTSPAPPPVPNANPIHKLQESIEIENGNKSFRIKFSDSESIIVNNVKIYNLNGQLVYEYVGPELNHSTDGLSSGAYLLRIETNQGFETQKINISQ